MLQDKFLILIFIFFIFGCSVVGGLIRFDWLAVLLTGVCKITMYGCKL